MKVVSKPTQINTEIHSVFIRRFQKENNFEFGCQRFHIQSI